LRARLARHVAISSRTLSSGRLNVVVNVTKVTLRDSSYSESRAKGLTIIGRHFAIYFLPHTGNAVRKAALRELCRIIRHLGSE
jgi:hypothetical protein